MPSSCSTPSDRRRLWLRPLRGDGIPGRQLNQGPAPRVIDANPPRRLPGHHNREFWRPCGLPGERMGSHFYLAPYIWGLRLTARPTAGRFAFHAANPAQPKGFVTRAPSPDGSRALSIFGQPSPSSRPKSAGNWPKLSLALTLYREPDSTLSRETRNRPSAVRRR
jgi:hypothetical protein